MSVVRDYPFDTSYHGSPLKPLTLRVADSRYLKRVSLTVFLKLFFLPDHVSCATAWPSRCPWNSCMTCTWTPLQNLPVHHNSNTKTTFFCTFHILPCFPLSVCHNESWHIDYPILFTTLCFTYLLVVLAHLLQSGQYFGLCSIHFVQCEQ